MKLSVVVSAFNEELKIEDCLRSVSFADEIIVIDNTSSDKTVEIAKKYTPKIFTKPNNLMLNVNKNFGFSKASGDWFLSLDADERITPELQREIVRVINNSKANGYWIPRKNIIFGKWIKYTGWYPDYQLRLVKKGKGKFPAKHVHEMIKVEGKTEKLTNPMVHYNYDGIFQFLRKMEIYVESESKNLVKEGYGLKVEDAINFPLKEFLSRFFAREGYKDGLHGLVLSLLMAFYHLAVFVRLWEIEGFRERNIDTLSLLNKESKTVRSEFKHWFRNEKIKLTKNPLKKILLKLLK
jgi:glycosyltransferase involved in cell wall biosynthesis